MTRCSFGPLRGSAVVMKQLCRTVLSKLPSSSFLQPAAQPSGSSACRCGPSFSTEAAPTALRGKGVPVVYHPQYSAPQLAAGHRFPMQVWRHQAVCMLFWHHVVFIFLVSPFNTIAASLSFDRACFYVPIIFSSLIIEFQHLLRARSRMQ